MQRCYPFHPLSIAFDSSTFPGIDNCLGEKRTSSATQLVTSCFGKLRDSAAHELKSAASDVVIAVPGWYIDIQRRAIQDATAIVGLNTLRITNDTTVAVSPGVSPKLAFWKLKTRATSSFSMLDHSSMAVAAVAFSKGLLVAKATTYGRYLGGCDTLFQHFAAGFEAKCKIDVLSNPKATFRLPVDCEHLKKCYLPTWRHPSVLNLS